MGFGSRIGSLFKSAVHRIGSIHVATALNRIGAVASAASKVGSLINHATGGALQMGAEAYLGKKATNAIAGGVGYVGKAWDTAQMTKATMGNPMGGVGGGGANGYSTIWSGGTRPKVP